MVWWLALGWALAQDADDAPGVEPPAPSVEELGSEGSEGSTIADVKENKPRRHKLEQNPYAHTDFTAYTLERRETRIGLTTVSHGLTQDVQLATIPLLDAFGVWNVSAKAQVVHKGPFDGALVGGIALIPVTDLANALLGTGPGTGKRRTTVTSSGTWLELGGRGSLRLADKWSAHLSLTYVRAGVKGEIDFRNLPTLVIPGTKTTIGTEELKVVPRVVGEAMQMRLASDYRFNRRDSIIAQFQAPLYVALRGFIDGESFGLPPAYANVDISVGYRDTVLPSEAFSASLAWQFSWDHIDLRVGVGGGPSPLPFWIFQAFDLTYRFGGETRKSEREVRQDYREDLRDAREEEREEEIPTSPEERAGDSAGDM